MSSQLGNNALFPYAVHQNHVNYYLYKIIITELFNSHADHISKTECIGKVPCLTKPHRKTLSVFVSIKLDGTTNILGSLLLCVNYPMFDKLFAGTSI